MKRIIGFLTLLVVLTCSTQPVLAAGQWHSNEYGWRLRNENGTSALSQWYQEEDRWYYFDTVGYMATGWYPVQGRMYYFGEDGVMQKNTWVERNRQWFYLGESGAVVRNTVTPDGYRVDIKGAMVTEERKLSWEQILSMTNEYYEANKAQTDKLLIYTNQMRRDAGVPELTINQDLCKVAVARALHMHSYGYFSHYYGDVSQAQYVTNICALNAEVGENIAWNSINNTEPSQIMTQWQNSEGHYKNMMSRNYTQVGVAYVPTESGIYAVQVFSR